MSVLLALYPKDWRERYEDEMGWLLADRPPSIADGIDLIRGAFDAHLHLRRPGPDRVPDRAGWVPLGGGLSLLLAIVLFANGPVIQDEYGSYRDGAAGAPFFLLAFILLSVGVYRVVERLPASARATRLAGSTAIVAGLTWAVAPWLLPVGLTFMLAMLGLGVGARRAGLWPTWALALLAPASLVPAATIVVMLIQPWYALRGSPLPVILIFVPVVALWPIVGSVVLRGSLPAGQGAEPPR